MKYAEEISRTDIFMHYIVFPYIEIAIEVMNYLAIS